MGSHTRSGQELGVFVVSGSVSGSPKKTATSSPAYAAALLANWLRDDPNAKELSWVVDAEAATAVFAARLRKGLIGETARIAHIFVVHPGNGVGPTLTSVCKKPFPWYDLEFETALGKPMGQPCLGCQALLAPPPPPVPIAPPPADRASHADWSGWDDYYRELGWPVSEVDGQLLLAAGPDVGVVVISLDRALGEQVREALLPMRAQPPVLTLPTLPDQLLFIVERTNIPAPIPKGVLMLAAAVPLYPSPTIAGEAVWHVAPDEVEDVRRCNDMLLLTTVNTVRAARPRREVTS